VAIGNILNPSFETAGVADGQADQWTEEYPNSTPVGTQLCAEEIAAFATGSGDTPYEGFEGGWDSNETAQSGFEVTDILAALFNDGLFQSETFEYDWALPSTSSPSNPRWNHQSEDQYDAENFVVASFDSAIPEDTEDFEEEWDDNEDYEATLDDGTTIAASFDSGTPQTVEDFEEEWQDNEDYEATLDDGTTVAAAFAGTGTVETFEGAWTLTL